MGQNAPLNTGPTYGEGAVAVFPRGAINHPSLLMSACVLFDSVTVLRPVDILAESSRREIRWDYRLRSNREADDFWYAVRPLVESEIVRPFRSGADMSRINKLHDHPNSTPFGRDVLDVDKDATAQTWYIAAGFTEYFQYIGANGLPLLLSELELHDVSRGNRLPSSLNPSVLSASSARMLDSCLPEIEARAHAPDRLILHANDIRRGLQHERAPYTSLIGRLAVLLTEPHAADERVSMIDSISSDAVDIWEAYRVKLIEIGNKLSLPVKFVPLLKNVVTLDQIACGKHLLGERWEPLSGGQQKRLIAFIWRVPEIKGFWRMV